MPISFSQVNSVRDILSMGSFSAFFGPVPGGGSGQDLTLRNTDISIPTYEVAQIIVKILGWSTAFAGRRVQTNTMTMSFYEVHNGTSLQALLGWQNAAAGFVVAGGLAKNQYAIQAEVCVYDTTGQLALLFEVNNIWPLRVNVPAIQDGSDPAKIDVDFSVDNVDFVGVINQTTNTLYSNGYNSPTVSLLNKAPAAQSPFNMPVAPETRMDAKQSLTLMNSFLSMPISGTEINGRNANSTLGVALGVRI